MTSPTDPTQRLSDEQRVQLDQIRQEIAALVDRGDLAPALASLDGIRQNVPDSDEYRLLRAALLALRADLQIDIGDMDDAWNDARRAMDQGFRDASTLEIAGWARFGQDRPEAARDCFDEALELDPTRTSCLLGRALALLEIDELQLALSDLNRGIQLAPDDPELYAARSDVMVRQRSIDAAERDLARAIELAPHDPDHRLNHARVLMVQQRLDEAADSLEPAAADEDASLEALLMRSHLSLMRGDSPAARADAIRASNRYPDEAFALVQLAQVQLAEGKLNLAKKAAERAVELDPTLPDTYLVRGAAASAIGDADAASSDFERARSAPAELPMLLLGNCYDLMQGSGLQASIQDLLQDVQPPGATSNGPRPAGFDPAAAFGGLDPMQMMGKLFDDSGQIKGSYKPLLRMAMKNAPKILKNMPPGLLKNMGGIDPSQLDGVDFDSLSAEDLEAQMESFYQMMQSGRGPFGNTPNPPKDDDHD